MLEAGVNARSSPRTQARATHARRPGARVSATTPSRSEDVPSPSGRKFITDLGIHADERAEKLDPLVYWTTLRWGSSIAPGIGTPS